MKLNKIKRGLELARAEEVKQLKNNIKKLDLKSGERVWCGWKWNGGDIYTKHGLTDRESQRPEAEQKKIILYKELKELERKFKKHFEELEELEKVDYLPKVLEISINWHTSRTWGACPSAEMWARGVGYYEGGTVGGCGYDKRSTAAAEVLGKCKELKAAAFAVLNAQKLEYITKCFLKYVDQRELLGYGLHLGALSCSFGGGCGMGSILEELEHLGYKVTARHEPNRGADFYQLEQDPKNKAYKTIKKALQGGQK